MVKPEDVAVHHRKEPTDDIHDATSPEKDEEKEAVEPCESDSDVGDGYTNWKEE